MYNLINKKVIVRKEYNYEVQKSYKSNYNIGNVYINVFCFFCNVICRNDNTYSCDFTSLVKNNADTTYGTADDIYDIDDYTKAVLTYTGTYVSADGKVYLKSSKVTNANSSYSNGSYVSFTARQTEKQRLRERI